MSAANSRTGRPTSQPGHRFYRELQPGFEWEEEASSYVLNIFLPGFVKERLKLAYDEPTRTLNIWGERAIGNNKFSWYKEDFRIPDNARVNEMRARFQSETLTVTVPKQTLISLPPLPPLPPQAPKPTQITSRGTEFPKEAGRLKNKPQERDGLGKETPSILIPPSPMPPLPTQAPKPIPTSAPRTEAPKVGDGMKDRPMEWDGSLKSSLTGDRADPGEGMIPMKEMKAVLEEERKGNVVTAAAIVLIAVGAYICYYTLGMGRKGN